MIPEGTIKLIVTLGEPPRTTIVVIDFLVVNCQCSAGQTIIKGPESSDIDPLPDSKVPHSSGDM